MPRQAWLLQKSEDFQGAVERWREQVDGGKGTTVPDTVPHSATNPTPPAIANPNVGTRKRRANSFLLEDSPAIRVTGPLGSDSQAAEKPRLKKLKCEGEVPSSQAVPATLVEPISPASSISPSSTSSARSFFTMSSEAITSSPKSDNMDAGPIKAKLEDIRERLGKSLDGRILGYMPVAKFLDAFLPKGDVEELTGYMPIIEKLVNLQDKDHEKQLHQPLADAFTELSNNRIKFRVSGNKIDKATKLRWRPDVMGYNNHSSPSDENVTNWRAVDIFVEAKLVQGNDGFLNISYNDSTGISQKTRAQIIHYMDSQWKYQQREHAFCVQFLGKTSQFRLLRFDPAGIIVSESLHLGIGRAHDEDNRLLADFLYRFGRASRRTKGWSPGWERVNVNEQHHKAISESLGCKPEFKITINQKTYYTGPRRTPRFFRSRATVGYRATRHLPFKKAFVPCFLKETWGYQIIKFASCEGGASHGQDDPPLNAPHTPDDSPPKSPQDERSSSGNGRASTYRLNEGEVYAKLQKNKVDHVPTLVIQHEFGSTHTNDYIQDDWINQRPDPLTKQVHRLLVLEECARPLEEFKTVKEMLTAWKDALTAYKHSIQKADQIHRDISCGNILIKDDGTGLLCDWDQSVEKTEAAAHIQDWTGTVIFMAAERLQNRAARHEPRHDLESFYHVLAFITYFYAPNPLTRNEIHDLLDIYQISNYGNPLKSLGMHKRAEVQGCAVSNERLQEDGFAPLGPLLVDLRQQIFLPLQQATCEFIWEKAVDKMVELVDNAIESGHSGLQQGPFKPDVPLPWEVDRNVRNSVPSSKRSQSSQGGRAKSKRHKSSEPISEVDEAATEEEGGNDTETGGSEIQDNDIIGMENTGLRMLDIQGDNLGEHDIELGDWTILEEGGGGTVSELDIQDYDNVATSDEEVQMQMLGVKK